MFFSFNFLILNNYKKLLYFRFDDAVLFIQLYMKLNQDLKIEANDPNKLKIIEVIFFAVTFVLFIV